MDVRVCVRASVVVILIFDILKQYFEHITVVS